MAKISLSDLSKSLKGQTLDAYKKALKDSTGEWSKTASEETKNLIVETIQRGQSPVKGGQGQTGGKPRFFDYSPSYKSQIKKGRYLSFGKKLRPVNLTLSGKMLNSIKVRLIGDGFVIWFTSALAKYHNSLGAGKSKVIRKMLPINEGEEFTRLINQGLVDKFKSILAKNIKR